MNTSDLTYIPKRIRFLIVFLLFMAAGSSAGLCIYFALISPKMELAVVFLGAAQAAFTGLVVVLLISYSLRMKTADDIQVLQDNFFLMDIFPALELCASDRGELERYRRPYLFGKPVRKLEPGSFLLTDFQRGANSASISLQRSGEAAIDMYLKVNVFDIMVRYFFNPEDFEYSKDEAAFLSVFQQTINGAESVGFEAKILRRFHASKGKDVLELSFYMKISSGILSDPETKLFIRNDIRTLTDSILHSRKSILRANKV